MSSSPPKDGRRERGARDLLLVVVGLVVGVLLVLLLRGLVGGSTTDGAATNGATTNGVATNDALTDGHSDEQAAGDGSGTAGPGQDDTTGDLAVAPGDGSDTEPVEPQDAAEPIEALQGFLAHELDRDFEASFALLAPSDREQYGDAARWAAAHRQLLPVRGFRILDDTLAVDGGRATVDALVASDGVLDPVIGLVPAVSRSTWVLDAPEDVWRVRFGAASFEASLPDPADAVDAARQWVEAAAACEEPPSGVTRLLGAPDLVEEVCAAGGDVTVGEPGLLPPAGDAFGLVAAFGPEAIGWARVVPVDEPLALDVALAPLADGWRVVGALGR